MTKVLCGAVALLVFILIADGCELRIERSFETAADGTPKTAGVVVEVEVRR